MKINLLLFFLSLNAFSSEIEILWTDNFRKELHLNCAQNELLCLNSCGDEFYCRIEEGPCKNCIGTSIKFNHLLESIGETLLYSEIKVTENEAASLIHSQEFITLTSRDVYNIIDPVNSLKLMKKFDKLCPIGSYESILFMQVEKKTRKLMKPRMVFCKGDENHFYKVTTDLHFELNQ